MMADRIKQSSSFAQVDLHTRVTVRGAYKKGILFHTQQQKQILRLAVFFATDHRKKVFIYSTLETFAYLEQHVQCKEEMKCVVGYFKETIKFAFLFLIIDGNYFSKSGSISYYQEQNGMLCSTAVEQN